MRCSGHRQVAGVLLVCATLAACAHASGGGPPVPLIQVSGAPLTAQDAEATYRPVLADMERALDGVYGQLVWASPGQHSRAWDGCGAVVGPAAVTVTARTGDDGIEERARQAVDRTLQAHGFPAAEDTAHSGPARILRSRDARGTVAEVTVGSTLNVVIVYAAQPGHCG